MKKLMKCQSAKTWNNTNETSPIAWQLGFRLSGSTQTSEMDNSPNYKSKVKGGLLYIS